MVSVTQSSIKLIIGGAQGSVTDTLTTSLEQVQTLLSLLQPKSLASIETAEGVTLTEAQTNSSDFWRFLFAALCDLGTIQAWLPVSSQESVASMLSMHGFVDLQFSNPEFQDGKLAVIAKKPAFKVGGTSLKRKNKQPVAAAEVNPWANLDQDANNAGENAQINEDSLMQNEDAIKAVTEQFAGECDRLMPGKPCADCTCGKKELQEGTITLDQLEKGQVESSCGKCYLGDAFRCAGCPFRGKPAFEAGDKVRLQAADTVSASADVARVQAAAVTTAETGTSKVVLEL